MKFNILICTILFTSLQVQAQVKFNEHFVTDTLRQIEYAEAFDIDTDGDMDVIVSEVNGLSDGLNSCNGRLIWLENDGNGEFTSHVMADSLFHLVGFTFLDFEDDGDLDLIAAAGDSLSIISWIENQDNSFVIHQLCAITELHFIETRTDMIQSEDMDGDEDLDLVVSNVQWSPNEGIYGGLVWFELDQGEFVEHVLRIPDVNPQHGAIRISELSDLDDDGDPDIPFIYSNNMFFQNSGNSGWWENEGGGEFTYHNLNQLGGYFPVILDINDDGYPEIFGNDGVMSDSIIWYYNDWGDFSDTHFIDSEIFTFNGFISTADFNIDGNNDLVLQTYHSHTRESGIATLLNDDELGFEMVTWVNTGSIQFLLTTDINGDAIPDLVTFRHHRDGGISWWENQFEVENVVDEENSTPEEINLLSVYPNPFNSSVKISFATQTKQCAMITIVNTLGQKLVTLADDHFPVGKHEVIWQPEHHPSGLYFCRMQVGSTVTLRKMLYIR